MSEHPDKFVGGRIDWRGHIYSPLPFVRSLRTNRINAGPFGTAGFPSIYRTDAHPFAYLPHSGRWQVAWMALLATAGGAAVVHARLAQTLLGLATVTLLVTLVKCALYGRHSDVSRLPLDRLAPSRHQRARVSPRHRMAAFRAAVRPAVGKGAGPHQAAQDPPPSARASALACRPVWGRRRSAMRFGCCCRMPVETSYWSQQWIDVADFLRSTANRLRQQRAVRQIELDSGWWQDRDLTITNRTWFRLNVRALVEDHGGGNCLHRVAVRSRLTAAAALPLLVAAAAAFALRYAGLSWVASTAIVGTLTVAVAVTSVLATCDVVLKALAAVAEASGMTAIPSSHQRRIARRQGGARAGSASRAGADEPCIDRRSGRLARHGRRSVAS